MDIKKLTEELEDYLTLTNTEEQKTKTKISDDLNNMVEFVVNNGNYQEISELLRLIRINDITGLIFHCKRVGKRLLDQEFGNKLLK